MRLVGGGCASCLLLLVFWTGTCHSDCLPPGAWTPPTSSAHSHGDDLDAAIGEADVHPGLSCACVAYAEIFGGGPLGYVRSPEFAEAVRAVAGGASRFSPREVPAAWATIAAEWGRHAAGHRQRAAGPAPDAELAGGRVEDGGLHLLREEEHLVPALVYLASIEYRLRQGRTNVSPVFPWILRKAHDELDARIAAKRRLAEEFNKRAADIAARISDAERRGAADHAPDMVARAKFELAFACRDAMDAHSSVGETGAAFDRAEKLAEAISRI